MSTFTIPTGDTQIDNLLAERSVLVQKFGNNSPEIQKFLAKNADSTFVDRKSGLMHTFEEIASGLVLMFDGITNQRKEEEWKSGSLS
jgi:hypothetical protein